MPIKIVDVHCTKDYEQEIPYSLGELISDMETYSIDKYIIAAQDKCLVVENNIGNNYFLSLIEKYPYKLLGCTSINLCNGKKAER